MESSQGKLAGRFAIVTGASRGLGRAICEHFVRAGAGLLFTSRDADAVRSATDQLRKLATGGQVVDGMVSDVSRVQDCRAAVARAAELGGGIDILVNNAGVYGPMGPIEEIDFEQFVSAIQINLFGTVMMCREVIPLMRRQNGGKIINLSGGGGATPLPRIDAYAASKAAVVRLTENLAIELADAGIDVNAIAPGALNTKMLEQVLEAGPQRVGQEFYERSLRQRDEGGAGLEKGASLAVFLASADSDRISGRLISAVWDDWANLPKHRDELARGDIYTLRRIVPKDRGQAW
jgi:NAD(P)-dependent dehydrogenase (short-subunit alcohol dehydrogenase family)